MCTITFTHFMYIRKKHEGERKDEKDIVSGFEYHFLIILAVVL